MCARACMHQPVIHTNNPFAISSFVWYYLRKYVWVVKKYSFARIKTNLNPCN